jgi:hypothetical protein
MVGLGKLNGINSLSKEMHTLDEQFKYIATLPLLEAFLARGMMDARTCCLLYYANTYQP